MARRVEANTAAAARTWALNVSRLAKARAPVRTGYLKKSIYARKIGPKAWRVRVGASYGIYVEYGTRYMAAQPYLRPAIRIANKQFRKDLRAVFKR